MSSHQSQIHRFEAELRQKDKHIESVLSVALEDSRGVSSPSTELMAVLRSEKASHQVS